MNKSLVVKKKNIYECILKCKDSKVFYKFPRGEAACNTWLERIGLSSLPRFFSTARICNNHFSERMFTAAKRLTSCALPDLNIPGKVIDVTPDGNLTIVKPRLYPITVNLADIPRIINKPVIITSRDSKCLLKCKDAKITFGFPPDKPSIEVWAKQLHLTKMPPRSARVCENHFSERMMICGKRQRLTMCAIPDINLPSQSIFKPEEKNVDYVMGTEMSNNPTQVIMNTIEETLQKNDPPLLRQEIAINPTANVETVIYQKPNKEEFLQVLQECTERQSKIRDGVAYHTALPETADDPHLECVLKCTDVKRIFRFPKSENRRQIWLNKIGLTHCFFNSIICNRHFSDRMYTESKKRLNKFAYPDINLPEPEPEKPGVNSTRSLHDYRLTQPSERACDVMEIPEYICVLTVFKKNNDIDDVVNGTKYIQHKIGKKNPTREREVQVGAIDLIKTASVAILTEDQTNEVFEIEEIVDNQNQLNWIDMFRSDIFESKGGMYECLICGEVSRGFSCKFKHLNIHQGSSLVCFQCGRVFSNGNKLRKHEDNKHQNRLKKALRCPKVDCRKAFYSKKKLFHHVDNHTKFNQHKCFNCLRIFSSTLKLHCHQLLCRKNLPVRHSKIDCNSTRSRIKC